MLLLCRKQLIPARIGHKSKRAAAFAAAQKFIARDDQALPNNWST
jgi:hypothetical protein